MVRVDLLDSVRGLKTLLGGYFRYFNLISCLNVSHEYHLLTLNFNLPAPPPPIRLQLINTPGELWSNQITQAKNTTAWNDLLDKVRRSRYVVLILHPHRDQIKRQYLERAIRDHPQDFREILEGSRGRSSLDIQPILDAFYPAEVWARRLAKNLEFFDEECRGVRRFFLCLHKADLFCDIQRESSRWRYNPLGGNDWSFYFREISQPHFGVAREVIRDYNSRQRGPSKLSFFITTKYNRDLLEVPWLDLGAYLAQDSPRY